ncbi:MAG: ABC transporter ATP-binding protein [Chitinophagaceae bacterium]
MSLLSVSGISKQGTNGFVLQDISFTQQTFQKIAIAGETGSGKSTLMKIIAGLASPDAGAVWFENERVKKVPEEKLIPGHAGIAYLSQQFELPNNLTVEQVLIYNHILSDDDAATDASARQLYKLCHIHHLLDRRTDQLSGGEKQRVALARLLVAAPRLLLMDEPFSNLDMIHKNILKSVIQNLGEKLGLSCILVSHDPLDTLSWADEIIVMKDGRISQRGTPATIYNKPMNEYVAGLFGFFNEVNLSLAEILSHLPGLKMNGKNMLIRPEHFILATEDDGALRGVVKRVLFYGSYYELEVLLNEDSIVLKTIDCNLEKGSVVYISLDPAQVIYV